MQYVHSREVMKCWMAENYIIILFGKNNRWCLFIALLYKLYIMFYNTIDHIWCCLGKISEMAFVMFYIETSQVLKEHATIVLKMR